MRLCVGENFKAKTLAQRTMVYTEYAIFDQIILLYCAQCPRPSRPEKLKRNDEKTHNKTYLV